MANETRDPGGHQRSDDPAQSQRHEHDADLSLTGPDHLGSEHHECRLQESDRRVGRGRGDR